MTYRGTAFKGEEGSVTWVHVSEPIMGEEALCLKNRECNPTKSHIHVLYLSKYMSIT